MRYCFSEWLLSKRTQISNVGEDVEKRKPSYTVGGNINWYRYCGKQWRSLKKLEIELPYDPVIPLLGTYQGEKTKNTNLKRYMHPSVHSSIIYNCQDMKAA